jgi:hypothetical protein
MPQKQSGEAEETQHLQPAVVRYARAVNQGDTYILKTTDLFI